MYSVSFKKDFAKRFRHSFHLRRINLHSSFYEVSHEKTRGAIS
ncbi:hypothetical protein D1AOALGA4SA_10168 [Olavius algarvensis Delta 1 endosymbiont]|nr:hypothetical protein D1AOALGA4SA_10168 [Olavius algarvensis Delta 1 endosymbiont]